MKNSGLNWVETITRLQRLGFHTEIESGRLLVEGLGKGDFKMKNLDKLAKKLNKLMNEHVKQPKMPRAIDLDEIKIQNTSTMPHTTNLDVEPFKATPDSPISSIEYHTGPTRNQRMDQVDRDAQRVIDTANEEILEDELKTHIKKWEANNSNTNFSAPAKHKDIEKPNKLKKIAGKFGVLGGAAGGVVLAMTGNTEGAVEAVVPFASAAMAANKGRMTEAGIRSFEETGIGSLLTEPLIRPFTRHALGMKGDNDNRVDSGVLEDAVVGAIEDAKNAPANYRKLKNDADRAVSRASTRYFSFGHGGLALNW